MWDARECRVKEYERQEPETSSWDTLVWKIRVCTSALQSKDICFINIREVLDARCPPRARRTIARLTDTEYVAHR